ncbi:MAG: tryptophan--tRNA ligase [Actinobacteria bacterium BACL4 MAG-120920-bin74]|jgi:tryptophanyl-tRNA synthetase|nr:MAG: tryptophan--tRNA ligase [Actinobacteria bacterium BACL4 MAG-120920-bin74]
MSNKRVLSGIQPTHDSFHLGNYLGALKQWVELQENNDAFYCVVDLHALTVETDPKLLQQRTLVSAAQLIAIGIDPDKSTLFVQSQVPAHNQLAWVFECITGFGEASRMTQFKDKSKKGGAERTNVGLFTYPILQAADILLYQPDFVPVGEDQRQHVELTRDIAERFNKKFDKVFNIPQAQIIKSLAKINDLQDPTAKMSKSATSMSGVIELLDSADTTMKKFKSSVTDDGKEVRFDEKGKPGISNLLTIHSALSGKSITELENDFSGKGYGDFKTAVAEVVISTLEPIAKRTNELMSDRSELTKILKSGAIKANQVASETLKAAYSAIGLIS